MTVPGIAKDSIVPNSNRLFPAKRCRELVQDFRKPADHHLRIEVGIEAVFSGLAFVLGGVIEDVTGFNDLQQRHSLTIQHGDGEFPAPDQGLGNRESIQGPAGRQAGVELGGIMCHTDAQTGPLTIRLNHQRIA